MHNKFKNKLKKILKNKYQKSIFTKGDFIIRETIIKEIKKKNNNNNIIYNNSSDYNFFKNEFRNKQKLLKYYHKFNVNLNLKKKYDKNQKKISNKNCSLDVLLLFCQNLNNIKNINKSQKLNTILKINDILIIQYLDNKIKPTKKILQNFKLEHEILAKFFRT